MSDFYCEICKNAYNKDRNKPIILECGDTLCLVCINAYKELLQKESFECPKCCIITRSLNIENKNAYPKGEINNQRNQRKNEEKFIIYVRPRGGHEKFDLEVTKQMTVGQLIEKIQREKGYDYFDLAFKGFLIVKSKTLESYGIIKSVTLTMINEVAGGGRV